MTNKNNNTRFRCSFKSSANFDLYNNNNNKKFSKGLAWSKFSWLSLEWCIMMKCINNSFNGTTCSSKWNKEAEEAQSLEQYPFATELLDVLLRDVHFGRKVHGEWPKASGTEKSKYVVEEWHQNCQKCCKRDKNTSPDQPEHVDIEFETLYMDHGELFV